MPAGAAAGQRRVCAVLHPRKPCSRKAVRLGRLRDLIPVFLPIGQSECREYRTLPADPYRPFSMPTVADRNRTTSYCVTSEISSRLGQICCRINGGSSSPAAGGKVPSSCSVRNTYMRVPVMRRHPWCHVTQNRTAGDGLRFVHGRLDRFFSDGLGACPPHPFLFESYGSEPSIARPFGPRDWR
jgi:hypothetical protein